MALTVNGNAGGINHPPPLKWAVKAKITENDPSMKIKTSGTQISIKGTASNRGIVASFASFEVGGKKINLSLSRGETPAQLLSALKKRLPAGYSIMGTPSSFQIMRG